MMVDGGRSPSPLAMFVEGGPWPSVPGPGDGLARKPARPADEGPSTSHGRAAH